MVQGKKQNTSQKLNYFNYFSFLFSWKLSYFLWLELLLLSISIFIFIIVFILYSNYFNNFSIVYGIFWFIGLRDANEARETNMYLSNPGIYWFIYWYFQIQLLQSLVIISFPLNVNISLKKIDTRYVHNQDSTSIYSPIWCKHFIEEDRYSLTIPKTRQYKFPLPRTGVPLFHIFWCPERSILISRATLDSVITCRGVYLICLYAYLISDCVAESFMLMPTLSAATQCTLECNTKKHVQRKLQQRPTECRYSSDERRREIKVAIVLDCSILWLLI